MKTLSRGVGTVTAAIRAGVASPPNSIDADQLFLETQFNMIVPKFQHLV